MVDYRADYAEMFESLPEFGNKKIPRGTSVVLEGDKIRPARDGELPFGVISSFPIMLGNTGSVDGGSSWGGKYLRDEFGTPLRREVKMWVINRIRKTKKEGIKKEKILGIYKEGEKLQKGAKVVTKRAYVLNPDYDPNKTYIPRIDRPEWNMVGLIGKLKILKGQPLAPNWIKLKEISEKIDEYLIR